MDQPLTLSTKLSRFASSIAPGIFLIGYVIGTGSVTTMASAGANYGMSLTWTLVLASFFTYVMFVAVSKCTIVTGKTILHNFRTHFGAPLTIFIIIGLMTTQIASIIGVMGIVTDVVQVWSQPFTASGAGIPPLATAFVFAGLLCTLFWIGRHELFLKALAFLVALMGISFFITMFLADTNWSDFTRGLVPSVPETGNASLLIAGMIGTTMAAIVVISRSVLVQEKGWTAADFKTEHRDAFVSVTLMFVINTAIVASAAGTMHVAGLRIDRAIDMVKTLEPLAGEFAVSAFVVGIVSAALSSLFPNFLLGPWLLCDYMGAPRDLKSPRLRMLVLATAATGFIVPIFGGSPVPIMIASQAISPIVMPLIVALVAVLLLRKDIVGEYKNGFLMNAGLGITFVFCVYILYLSVLGFLTEAA